MNAHDMTCCSFCRKDITWRCVLPVLCHHEDTFLVWVEPVESTEDKEIISEWLNCKCAQMRQHEIVLSLVPLAKSTFKLVYFLLYVFIIYYYMLTYLSGDADYKQTVRAMPIFVMDLTLRNVKAVHFSSSVPSGDSMRPVKQAFQISRTNRGVGILCRGQTILKDCTSKT